MLEAEDKTSWDVINGIVKPEYRDQIIVHKEFMVEGFFEYLSYYTKRYPEIWPSLDTPFLFLQDSLGGLSSRGALEEAKKRTYGYVAGSWYKGWRLTAKGRVLAEDVWRRKQKKK